MSRDLHWRIEETCFNAFPSLKQVLFGSWLMRFSAGVSRRGNSVNPLSADCPDTGAAIALAETVYRAQRQPAIFRVPSIADPALDRALAARGYTQEGETCVLHGAIADVNAGADPGVRLLPTPESEWLGAMSGLQGHSVVQAETYRRIVGAIAVPACFALLPVEGAPAALAYGAVHDGLLCYESVITDPQRRRQGLSRRVIGSLAAWARDSGAESVCLQVEAGNTPARALYAGLGMSERYRYHYRREPPRG